jgi:hypothetical protein
LFCPRLVGKTGDLPTKIDVADFVTGIAAHSFPTTFAPLPSLLDHACKSSIVIFPDAAAFALCASTASAAPLSCRQANRHRVDQYLKRKNAMVEVTVRDLEGVEGTVVIPPQPPQVR